MIELLLVGVRVELPSNTPIVLLKERDGDRFLPIFIGAFEATAIAFALQGVVTQRPMTHDLMKSMLDEMGVSVEHILITDLQGGTFYATIRLNHNGTAFEVSSRPSDAIALAVRGGVPMFVNPDVLEEASIMIREGDEDLDPEETVERFKEFLEGVSPEDFRG